LQEGAAFAAQIVALRRLERNARRRGRRQTQSNLRWRRQGRHVPVGQLTPGIESNVRGSRQQIERVFQFVNAVRYRDQMRMQAQRQDDGASPAFLLEVPQRTAARLPLLPLPLRPPALLRHTQLIHEPASQTSCDGSLAVQPSWRFVRQTWSGLAGQLITLSRLAQKDRLKNRFRRLFSNGESG
jgi:hypothetical protein